MKGELQCILEFYIKCMHGRHIKKPFNILSLCYCICMYLQCLLKNIHFYGMVLADSHCISSLCSLYLGITHLSHYRAIEGRAQVYRATGGAT